MELLESMQVFTEIDLAAQYAVFQHAMCWFRMDRNAQQALTGGSVNGHVQSKVWFGPKYVCQWSIVIIRSWY